MKIKYRDYISVSEDSLKVPEQLLRTWDASESADGKSLLIKIDATHSGRITNRRVYPGRKMKKATKSWYSTDRGGTSSYDKPVLKNHDERVDPLGRVIKAEYVHLKNGKDFTEDYLMPDLKGPGSGFIRLTANISDEDAIAKFLDGRFQTVSTSQSSSGQTCSICDKEMIPPYLRFLMGMDDDDEDSCSHIPGRVYTVKNGKKKEKKLCYAITGDLEYYEVSPVNTPGDAFAKVSQITSGDYKDSEEIDMTAESYEYVSVEQGARIHTFRVADSEGNILKPVDKTVHQVNWKEVTNVSDEVPEDKTPEEVKDALESLLSVGFIKKADNSFYLNTEWENEDFQLFLDNLENITVTSDEQTDEIYIKHNPPKEGPSTGPDVEDVEDEECLESDSESDTQVEKTPSNDSSDKTLKISKRGSVMDKDKATEDVVDMSATELKDLVSTLQGAEKTLKDQAEKLQVDKDKLEADLKERNEQITSLNEDLATQTSESKKVLARALVASNVIAGRPSVKEVQDKESFETAVNKLAERTLDSLSDSLIDVMGEVLDKVLNPEKEEGKEDTVQKALEDEKTEPKTDITDPSTNGSVDSFEQLLSKY